MRKSFLKAFGYFACFAWSGMTYAVGFGGVNVTSALGQPLVAEIELVSVEPADKLTLNARLASPEAFKGAGIDYPYSLPKIKFSVETRADGASYIKATSTQPVNEPFVSLLVELGWASGRLLREYTFLLDPPGFVAEKTEAAVKPIEPVVAAAPQVEPVAAPESLPVAAVPQATAAPVAAAVAEAASAVVAAEPAPVAMPEPVPAKAEEKIEPAPVKQKAEASPLGTASVTVKRGDTLSKIATQTKPTDVSLDRMLVALYRANVSAFQGKNMNRLSTGKILRMPEADALAKLKQAEAIAEVHTQVADWNEYRQKLAVATASKTVTDQPARQEVAGKISTTLMDKAPEAKESAKEVLKLSKGEAPSDNAAAGGKAKSASDKAIAKGEEAIAKTKALKEAEQRTALLEKSVKDMQRLVELKNQAEEAARASQEKVAASASAPAPASAMPLLASAVAPASTVAAASAVPAAKPQPKKVAAPKVVTPPSLMDEILQNPIYLGAGAALLLGLGGLGVKLARRKKEGATAEPVASTEDVAAAAGRIAAPIAPSPETGDFTNTVAAASVAVEDAGDVDPIKEADLFLNFGRDVQAEEVLKEALKKTPGNNPVKLKLLSIYANRKDTKSFYVYAMEVKASGDAAAWAEAATMGRALEPNNALYGGTGEAAVAQAAPAEELASPAVDFDLGFGEESPQKAPAPSSAESTVVLSASELLAAQEAPMDFDITSAHSGQEEIKEEPKSDVSAMDFDLTVVAPVTAPAVPEEPALDMAAMDFDLTSSIPMASVAAAEEEPAPALNLDDLVFDVTATHAAPAAPVESVPAFEADQGMAFTIDIPDETKPAVAAKPSAPVMDVGLGEISLNLDAPVELVAPEVSEPKGEQWHEVATKLDLAKAYQEMGDQDGAREILEEVVRDGDATQRETAESLLQQLS